VRLISLVLTTLSACLRNIKFRFIIQSSRNFVFSAVNGRIDLEKVTKIHVLLPSSLLIGCRTSSRSTDHPYLSTNP
jgi:hypothetical protein